MGVIENLKFVEGMNNISNNDVIELRQLAALDNF